MIDPHRKNGLAVPVLFVVAILCCSQPALTNAPQGPESAWLSAPLMPIAIDCSEVYDFGTFVILTADPTGDSAHSRTVQGMYVVDVKRPILIEQRMKGETQQSFFCE